MSSFFFDFHYAISYFHKSIHSKFKVFLFSYSGQFWAHCYFIRDINKVTGILKARSDHITNTKLISTYEWIPKEVPTQISQLCKQKWIYNMLDRWEVLGEIWVMVKYAWEVSISATTSAWWAWFSLELFILLLCRQEKYWQLSKSNVLVFLTLLY